MILPFKCKSKQKYYRMTNHFIFLVFIFSIMYESTILYSLIQIFQIKMQIMANKVSLNSMFLYVVCYVPTKSEVSGGNLNIKHNISYFLIVKFKAVEREHFDFHIRSVLIDRIV